MSPLKILLITGFAIVFILQFIPIIRLAYRNAKVIRASNSLQQLIDRNDLVSLENIKDQFDFSLATTETTKTLQEIATLLSINLRSNDLMTIIGVSKIMNTSFVVNCTLLSTEIFTSRSRNSGAPKHYTGIVLLEKESPHLLSIKAIFPIDTKHDFLLRELIRVIENIIS